MNIDEQKLIEEMSKLDLPSIKHFRWEEDGKQYSSHQIKVGNIVLNCGDGGWKLFEEAFKKKMNEL